MLCKLPRLFFSIIVLSSMVLSCRHSEESGLEANRSVSDGAPTLSGDQNSDAGHLFALLKKVGGDTRQYGPDSANVSAGRIKCLSTFVGRSVYSCEVATKAVLADGKPISVSGAQGKDLYDLLSNVVKPQSNGSENSAFEVSSVSCTVTALRGVKYMCNIKP